MKKFSRIISLFLVSLMLFGALAACTNTPESSETTSETKTETTVKETVESTESEGTEIKTESEETDSSTTEADSVTETDEDVTTEATESETVGVTVEETEEETLITGEDAELIEWADKLANGVMASKNPQNMNEYIIENSNMKLTYPLLSTDSQQVASLTNKKGGTYIADTMDVFVTMTDGNTYYASNSFVGTATNVYRMGYYFYETRLENQVFVGENASSYYDIDVRNVHLAQTKRVTVLDKSKDESMISVRIDDADDPGLAIRGVKFDTAKYRYIQFTIKAWGGVGSNAEIFIIAGDNKEYSSEQRIEQFISADGKWHTYTVPISNVSDFYGSVKGIRFDINGKAGSFFDIKDVKAVEVNENAPGDLTLCRSFLAYSDKLHHVIQVAASKETDEISQIGTITRIPTDTVESIIIIDKGGVHYSLEDKIAWNHVQGVGFLIKGVGVFGYMMPYDGKGGSIRVTLEDDGYVIKQYSKPTDGVIAPSVDGTGNANDFYLGQRVYTDTEKNFDKFIFETACEANPLTSKNIIINPLKSGNAKFDGYDSLRGCYTFTVDAAAGFIGPYAEYPNRHFGVEFTVKGDDKDRKTYFMTYTPQGSLECAALLNEQRMLLPIPIEVCKNFLGDKENNIFMKDDAQYGEAIIPLIVNAGDEDTFSFLNLYQNWGNFPLKQISSIQYFSPYYHLSCGTTETNCIVPYGNNGLGLPDFRGMSAPIWSLGNPQHNSAGGHSFVRYTVDGNDVTIAGMITDATIASYGPTYADMTTEYTTHDGKLKFIINHMEQPHTDENRTYIRIDIEVIDELTISNFKEDFYFYGVQPNDPTGVYQRVGYLDSNNESKVVAANKSGEVVEYILGDNAPYFSFFDMDDYSADFNHNATYTESGYANVAMLIADSRFVIGGEEVNPSFVLRDITKTLRLTLDMGETTLKAGDRLTIDGILLPWGSQEMEGSYDEIQDKNVRDVREDSIINPLKATAVENCVAEKRSVGIFLPELVSTNGKSATFTLSGGANNNAVRIYGFDTLTVPVIEKLVGDKWVTYEVSSINSRDPLGYGHQYDGYNVFYDGDGTYSYSFVVDMEQGEQTFRITVDKEFEGWGEEKDPTENLPLNVYIEPGNMAELGATLGITTGCTSVINLEGGFFRFYGSGKQEGYLTVYNESPLYPTTGQYFVLKYRLPVSNKSKITYFDVFTSTSEKNAHSGNGLRTHGAAIKDGEWHVLVIDLTAIDTYKANKQGEYIAKFLRLDVLNSGSNIPETDYIDIAYYGFSDNLEDICKLNAEESELLFTQDATLKKINPESGEVYVEVDPITYYFTPSEIMGMTTGGCDTLLSSDGSFVRFSGRGSSEGYVFPYENSSASNVTGQYFIVKYRIPTGVSMASDFEIFASTEKANPDGGSRLQIGGIVKGDEWFVLVVDLSKIATYNAVDGNYNAKHIRFDIINGKYTHTEDSPAYIDVAYMGLHTDLSELLKLNDDMAFITVVDAEGKQNRLTPDGTPYVEEEVPEEGIKVEVRPSDFAKPSGCQMTVADDGSYARFTATGSGEAYISVFTNTTGKTTGKYFAIKFKIPTGVSFPSDFQIFSSTQNTAPGQNNGMDQFQIGSIQKSDSWQLLIIDLSRIATFTADNGKYSANYIRFDIINGKYTHTEEAPSYVDVEFFMIHDSITEILAENGDMAEAILVDKSGKQTKIANDGSFIEPEEGKDRDEGDPLKVYVTPDELEDIRVRALDKKISEDGAYFTYTAKGAGEASVFVYENGAGDKATGRYFVFKYRVPEGSAAMPNNVEIFASTSNSGETAGDNMQIGNFISDGQWHVMVIDLSLLPTFTEKNGEYFTKYIRFDIINGKRDNTAWIDVAYFGIHDSLDEIYALNSDMESVFYVNQYVVESGLPVGKGTTVTLGE